MEKMLENLIKTWAMLAPTELPEATDPDFRYVGYLQECLNKREWSWCVSGDLGERFSAKVNDGPESVACSPLEALLAAYLRDLAVRRPIKDGGTWRHFKGTSVEVVGAAHWCGSAATEEGIAPLHRGAFILEESPGTIHLIQYVEAKYFSYIADRSYGERVCYHHGFQNWARPIGDFLALTPDGRLRFVEEVGPNTPNRFPES
jgi:hypothetical protein